MNKKVLKYITKALEVSLESDYKRVQIGTVLARSGHILSSAANAKRSHPRQQRYNRLGGRDYGGDCLHSEVHAIVRSGRIDLQGATAYVGRYERNGSLGNCKPCSACRIALQEAGIRKVFYTTPEGIKEQSYR